MLTVNFLSSITSYDISAMSFIMVSKTPGKTENLIVVEPVKILSSTTLQIRYNGGPQSTYHFLGTLSQSMPIKTPSVEIDNRILILGSTPRSGSIYGGTIVTLTGKNFLVKENKNQVIFVGDILVNEIISSTTTEIIFRTPSPNTAYLDTHLLIKIVHNMIYESSVPSVTTNQGDPPIGYFQYSLKNTSEISKLYCLQSQSYGIDDVIAESRDISFCNLRKNIAVGIVGRSLSFNSVSLNYPKIGKFEKINSNNWATYNANPQINLQQGEELVWFKLSEQYLINSTILFKLTTTNGYAKETKNFMFFVLGSNNLDITCKDMTPRNFSNYGAILTIYCTFDDFYDNNSVIMFKNNVKYCIPLKNVVIDEIKTIDVSQDSIKYSKYIQCYINSKYIELNNDSIEIVYNVRDDYKIKLKDTLFNTYSDLNTKISVLTINNIEFTSDNSKVVYTNLNKLYIDILIQTTSINLNIRLLYNFSKKYDYLSAIKFSSTMVKYSFLIDSGLPAGKGNLSFHIDNVGFVLLPNLNSQIVIFIPLYVTPITSLTSIKTSFSGGVNQAIDGLGFTTNYSIFVCGIKSNVSSLTTSKIQFITPSISNIELNSSVNIEDLLSSKYENLIEIYSNKNISNLRNLYNSEMVYNNDTLFDFNKQEYIGIRINSRYLDRGFKISITSLSLSASRIAKPYQINNGRIEGSNNGVIWELIDNLLPYFSYGWNHFNIKQNINKYYSYYRILLENDYSLRGVKFFGSIIASNVVNINCPVNLINEDENFTVDNLRILYESDKTLFIKIDKNNQSTTYSNINGSDQYMDLEVTNFNNSFNINDISINDISIEVYGNTVTDKRIINNKLSFKIPKFDSTKYKTTSISIIVANYGYVTVPNYNLIEYKGKWSELNTWGGSFLPANGSNVLIEYFTIEVDISPITLKDLVIQNYGKLIINDEKNITINVSNLIIRNGAELIVGTKENPIKNYSIDFNFQGNSKFPSMSSYSKLFTNNIIGVQNGKLTIHGYTPKIIKTQLMIRDTANKTLLVKDHVDWNINSKVILSWDDLDNKYVVNSIKLITNSSGEKLSELILSDAIPNLKTYDLDKHFVVLIDRNIHFKSTYDEKNRYGMSIIATKEEHILLKNDTSVQIHGAFFSYTGQASYINKFPISLENLKETSNCYISNNIFYTSVSF
jgi:hypothetical protein